MSRMKMKRALVTAVSMLLGAGFLAVSVDAHADNKPAATPGADSKPKSEVKADVKAEAKPAKADEAKPTTTTAKTDDKDKAEKKDPPGLAKGKTDPMADRAERKNKQREAQREQLKSSLKGPMTEAMRQELRRHAQRVARIERVKTLATEQKDKDATERADKLLAKENARHDKWMSNAIAASTTTPSPKPVDTNANAKAEVKGGAK